MAARNILSLGAAFTAVAIFAMAHTAHATTTYTSSLSTFQSGLSSQGLTQLNTNNTTTGATTSIPLASGNTLGLGIYSPGTITYTSAVTTFNYSTASSALNGVATSTFPGFGTATGYTGTVYRDTSATGLLVLNLASVENNLGLYIENTTIAGSTGRYNVSAWSGANATGTQLLAITQTGNGATTSSQFVGINSNVGLGSIVITYNNSSSNTIGFAAFAEGTVVPEPASLILLGSGLLGLGIARRRSSKV